MEVFERLAREARALAEETAGLPAARRAARVARLAARAERLAHEERVGNRAREAVFRAELRSELVDREAAAVRANEKLRVFLEKGANNETVVLERALNAAAAVESAIAALDVDFCEEFSAETGGLHRALRTELEAPR